MVMQRVLRAAAAARNYLAERFAVVRETKAEAHRLLASMQLVLARAQALVSANLCWSC